jgi:hypothetical protein
MNFFRNISWPAISPDLPACGFFSWGYLGGKESVFQILSADLHILTLRVSEEGNAVSPVISAQWKVL